jgi:hypothetical protein
MLEFCIAFPFMSVSIFRKRSAPGRCSRNYVWLEHLTRTVCDRRSEARCQSRGIIGDPCDGFNKEECVSFAFVGGYGRESLLVGMVESLLYQADAIVRLRPKTVQH